MNASATRKLNSETTPGSERVTTDNRFAALARDRADHDKQIVLTRRNSTRRTDENQKNEEKQKREREPEQNRKFPVWIRPPLPQTSCWT